MRFCQRSGEIIKQEVKRTFLKREVKRTATYEKLAIEKTPEELALYRTRKRIDVQAFRARCAEKKLRAEPELASNTSGHSLRSFQASSTEPLLVALAPRSRKLTVVMPSVQKKVNAMERIEHSPPTNTPSISTPVKEAQSLLIEGGITPRPCRIKPLLPYTTTMKCVRSATPSVKRSLFNVVKPKGVLHGVAKQISKKSALCRNNIFKKTDKKMVTRRKIVGMRAAQQVAEFLRREDNSTELPGKKDNVRYPNPLMPC